MTPVFKFSRGGLIAAGLFLLSALAVFEATRKNPADSGESGILLLPFAMPWIAIIPENWLGLAAGLGCILVNTLILYCVFGGLRLTRSKSPRP